MPAACKWQPAACSSAAAWLAAARRLTPARCAAPLPLHPAGCVPCTWRSPTGCACRTGSAPPRCGPLRRWSGSAPGCASIIKTARGRCVWWGGDGAHGFDRQPVHSSGRPLCRLWLPSQEYGRQPVPPLYIATAACIHLGSPLFSTGALHVVHMALGGGLSAPPTAHAQTVAKKQLNAAGNQGSGAGWGRHGQQDGRSMCALSLRGKRGH